MPTENELKYVLQRQFAYDLKNGKVDLHGGELRPPKSFQQAYLYGDTVMSVRVRGVNHCAFSMTVKQKIPTRVVEIETDISQEDFKDLWEASSERLCKDRYDYFVVRDGRSYKWEIDLFYDSDGTCYFVQAEHEMLENQAYPDFIPDLIQEYLLWAVPQADSGDFSSRKLSDVGYASYMYDQLK